MERALTHRLVLVQVLLAVSCFVERRRIPHSAITAMPSFGACLSFERGLTTARCLPSREN